MCPAAVARVALLLALGSATSCKLLSKSTDATDAAAPTDATAAAAVSSAAADADDDTTNEPPRPSEVRKPLTAEEKAARKSYVRGMAAGRRATLAKEYPTAISAFDQALAAKTDDPRALSERGYAKLLSKDFAGAHDDLTKALEGTEDPALQAQIYFNVGLVAEGKGEADGARVAFARSHALRATQAAKEKLEGKSRCIARIDRRPAKATVVPSLSAAWDAMQAAFVKHGHPLDGMTKKPATDAAIKSALCTAGCSGEPWFARFTQASGPMVGFAVTQEPANQLALYELDDARFGSCGGDLSASVGAGPMLHIRTRAEMRTRVWMKMSASKPTACDDQNDDCVSGCLATDFTRKDWFIDIAKQAVVMSVEESGPIGMDGKSKPVLTVKEAERIVDVTGGGCAEKLELR